MISWCVSFYCFLKQLSLRGKSFALRGSLFA
ncbi:hypothetical protein OIU84_014870 [Salix udensis]|uniref:Uncharacterized protein n=1 Tax=Salix udensis TaxID=889485 RepID=A0AAD6JD88_9ROSI|nr:hypothetical protein OIU84_014870 [Salix udensis]